MKSGLIIEVVLIGGSIVYYEVFIHTHNYGLSCECLIPYIFLFWIDIFFADIRSLKILHMCVSAWRIVIYDLNNFTSVTSMVNSSSVYITPLIVEIFNLIVVGFDIQLIYQIHSKMQYPLFMIDAPAIA